MLIYFVRHGQTDDNLRGVIQGQLDTVLNDHGRKEARLVADHLASVPFTEARSSSLSRASETASIIASRHDGLQVNCDPGLMERGLGSLEGHRRKRGEPLPGDVEPSDKFRTRIAAWFESFLRSHTPSINTSNAADSGYQNGESGSHHSINNEHVVLVVSHGAYLSTLLSLLLSPEWFDFQPSELLDMRSPCYNTSIMRVKISYDEGGTEWSGVVESWGEVEHLKSLSSEGHKSAKRVADDVKA